MDDRLAVMPNLFGQELQQWNARRVFSRLKDQMPENYTRRVLSLANAAELLHRNKTTVGEYVKWGLLKCSRVPHPSGNKWKYRFSLQDLADFIISGRLRIFRADHTWWTESELELLRQGYYLSSRSRKAAQIKRMRLGLPVMKLKIVIGN